MVFTSTTRPGTRCQIIEARKVTSPFSLTIRAERWLTLSMTARATTDAGAPALSPVRSASRACV
ncbi:MAG: hypothetical protein CMN31_23770 [Sandaracinus sp.]|nr:hypothetical protein [Sandaracinus sp.]MBJ74307.1 hypothetical protein [Sandaracinus sp.]